MSSESNRKRNTLYTVWWNIVRRCSNPDSFNYLNYGGRGINVCSEWKDDFKAFSVWAKANGYQPGLTVDRIDVNGNYEPSNCRWITCKEQANNRRTNRIATFKGVTGTMSQLCDYFGLDYGLVNNRIQKGWSEEQAFSLPKGAPTEKRNRVITFNGMTKSLTEWNSMLGGTKNTLSERLRNGFSIERALTEPVRKRG